MQNEDDQCFKWSVTREIPTVKALRQLAKERGLKEYSEAKLLEQLEIKVDQNQHRIDKKLQEQNG